MNTETYTFSHNDSMGLSTTVSFVCNTDGLTISGFSALCGRAALAFGWCENNVNEHFEDSVVLMDDLIPDEEDEL